MILFTAESPPVPMYYLLLVREMPTDAPCWYCNGKGGKLGEFFFFSFIAVCPACLGCGTRATYNTTQ